MNSEANLKTRKNAYWTQITLTKLFIIYTHIRSRDRWNEQKTREDESGEEEKEKRKNN